MMRTKRGHWNRQVDGGGWCPFQLWKARQAGETVGNIRKGSMRKYACNLCGREIEPGTVVIHNIVPCEVTQQTGMSDSETVKLCVNCCKEVEAWYLKRVTSTTYDWGSKRFRPKLPTEMVTEYEAAYTAFVKYKKWLLHIA